MSIKIDTPRDAFNLVKESCTTFAARVVTEPELALKIVGATLSVIVVVVWLSIILYKHRKARVENLVRRPRETRPGHRSSPKARSPTSKTSRR